MEKMWSDTGRYRTKYRAKNNGIILYGKGFRKISCIGPRGAIKKPSGYPGLDSRFCRVYAWVF